MSSLPGMPSPLGLPNIAGLGSLQRKAALLRAQVEASKRMAQPVAETKPDPAKAPATGTGPIGQGEYVVKSGDCTNSIAKDKGYFWETIWNDAANTELKNIRKDPNVLLPGDRVTLPKKGTKKEPGRSEMRHRFLRRGEPSLLRLRLMEGDLPRANQPYTIEIDDKASSGVTDPQGKLEIHIPGNARKGKLRVGPEGHQQEFPLKLGHVDPITEISGIQSRLNNLGFGCGTANGEFNARTRGALSRFQDSSHLKATGEPDQATRDKLLQLHGS